MTRSAVVIALALLAGSGAAFGQTVSMRDGQAKTAADGTWVAWDARNEHWVQPEVFWERYAHRRGGITWGRRSDYPDYDRVSELDTLLIVLESGPCLMEFFHTRWRRANDVRRWDRAFNDYGGCPHVFD